MVKQKIKKALPPPDLTTEQKILAAARQEFCERGIDGTRMQAIADRAGVNKALLHYYFRTKEKLFHIIIRDLVTTIWGKINRELDSAGTPADARTVISTLVSAYINTFAQNPEYPLILIHQLLHRDKNVPLILNQVIASLGEGPKRLTSLLSSEIRAGRIRKIEPIHFILNLIGMIMVTYVSRPASEMLSRASGLTLTYDEEFYETRIKAITDMICEGILLKE
ncbi:MAG TPA: helix-turn-helix domain-containing protein [Chitinivibrionales bacterium]|nr:helix-turn-helix domain-containing protein [Chitinivibrionales bacterium]